MSKRMKRIILVRDLNDRTTASFTVLRSECCNSVMVALGRPEDELAKCVKCNNTWSLERLGLKLVDGEYQFDNR